MTNIEWLKSPVSVAYLSPKHAAACKWAAGEIERLTEELDAANGLLREGRYLELFNESTAKDGEIERLEHERKLLAEAIRNAAVKRGVVSEDVSLTGPHLLMLCNDLAS
jgi:hypothetical protein